MKRFAVICAGICLLMAQKTLSQPATVPSTASATTTASRVAYDEQFHVDGNGGPNGEVPFDPFRTRLTLTFHPPGSAITAKMRTDLLKMADEADAEIERVWSAAKTPDERESASRRLNQMLWDREAAARKLISEAAANEMQAYAFITTGEWMALEQAPVPFLDMVLNELRLGAKQKDELKPIIERAKAKLPQLHKTWMNNMGKGVPAVEKAYRHEALKTLQEINGRLNKQQIMRLQEAIMSPAPLK